MVEKSLYLVIVTRASGSEAWLYESQEETTERAVSVMERTIARAEEFTGCYIIGCSRADLKTKGSPYNRTCVFSHDGDIMLQSAFDPVAGAVVVQTVESKSRIDKIANRWFEIYVKNLMNEGKSCSKD